MKLNKTFGRIGPASPLSRRLLLIITAVLWMALSLKL